MQDRNCKADGGSREKEREREKCETERAALSRRRCDLYPDIRRNSAKRYFNDFQTRSMEDPRGDLRYHYFPRGICLPVQRYRRGYTSTSSAERIYIQFSSLIINDFKSFNFRLSVFKKFRKKVIIAQSLYYMQRKLCDNDSTMIVV